MPQTPRNFKVPLLAFVEKRGMQEVFIIHVIFTNFRIRRFTLPPGYPPDQARSPVDLGLGAYAERGYNGGLKWKKPTLYAAAGI